MEASRGDESAPVLGAKGKGDSARTSRDGAEPDSETPLLVKNSDQGSDSQQTSPEVADTAKAFPKLKSKNKTGLWSVAAKPSFPPQQKDLTLANDLQQLREKESQQEKELRQSVESPVPSITVTEPSFDANANAKKEKLEERKDTTSSGTGKGQSSIHFSDVVMSTLPSQVSEISSYSAIEVVVYTMDNKGVTLILDEGRYTTSDVILSILLDDLRIPKKYKPCFGIWLSSPLLHLQLRPTHVPHMMARHWTRLLKRFTLATEDQLASDEPILRLQRNAFLSPAAELSIEHPEVIRLLFCEAKENVMEGLYPIDVDNCFRMAGVCAVAQFGPFVEADHPRGFYKEYTGSLLPEWIEKSRAALLGCTGSSLIARLFSTMDKARDKLSHELRQAHRTETERVMKSRSPEDSTSIPRLAQRQFLSKCYQLPFYGCAFFRAILYKPTSIFTAIWNLDRDGADATFPVTVAVSPRGVCLLDLSTDDQHPGSLILSIPFSELHWTVAELKDTENEPGLMSSTSPAVLPSLFLHFPHPNANVATGSESGSQAKKDFVLLQIVSKQALLIDAFMRTVIQLNQFGFANTPMSEPDSVHPDQLFGSGVVLKEFMNCDWEEEESILRRKDEEDQSLAMDLDRLRLKSAADFDE